MTCDLESIARVSGDTAGSQAFLALMSQVEAGTAMDTKLAFLRDNLQTAGKVVFKVLKAFV